MPDFLQFMQPKIEQVLGRLKINADDLFMNELLDEAAANEEEVKEPTVLSQFGYFDQCTVNDYMPG